MEWCWDRCERIVDIVSATDDEIVLWTLDTRGTAGENGAHNTASVNRITGVYQNDSDGEYLRSLGRKQCVRAPFIGIERKFQVRL